MPEEDKEQEKLSQLLSLLDEALKQDEALRQKYQIGEKFRFIHDRLQALLEEVKSGPRVVSAATTAKELVMTLEADEVLIYVHLYNAQGTNHKSWQSIITPRAFFDFSVNRPIYKEKAHVEAFVRAKTNKLQHGYLTVAVKVERISKATEVSLKDAMGHPLIKVKEGSLLAERLWSFCHNEQEYVLTEEGDLVKKF